MSDFSQKVTLGRSGLRVSRIGVGSSYRMRTIGEHVHGIRSFMATFT